MAATLHQMVCSAPLISLPLSSHTRSRVTTRTDQSYPPMHRECRPVVGRGRSGPLMCTLPAPRWWWFPSSSCPSPAPLRATSSPRDRWVQNEIEPNDLLDSLIISVLWFFFVFTTYKKTWKVLPFNYSTCWMQILFGLLAVVQIRSWLLGVSAVCRQRYKTQNFGL